MLKQISVVASDLKQLTLRIKTKPDLDHFAIPARMIDPKRRIRRKIRDFSENMLWFDILLQLHKKAFAADERVQGVIRLHLVDLISRQIAFTKRRHAEVNEACCQRGMTQPASSVPKRPNVQRRAILKDLMHAIPCVPFPGVICYSRIETSRSETGILAPVSFSESVRLVYISNAIGDFIFL